MEYKKLTFDQINGDINSSQAGLEAIGNARREAKRYLSKPSPGFAERAAMKEFAPGARQFRLMAQGDSWFDYFPGSDIIDCLHEYHGHSFEGANGAMTNLAVGGSTLNDEAYGPVPTNLLGVPQSNEISRIVELVHRIQQDKPQALLLSAGGNDVAGAEFFSFINNAASGLPEVNEEVVHGALNQTFKKAYEYLIDNSLKAAQKVNITMPIFLHGYDYPWPDGRGVIDFLAWKIGPWFHDSFNHKNYPYNNANDLLRRHDVVKRFIDPLNDMLKGLQTQYSGHVFYVNLRGTLRSRAEWANELHPVNEGFKKLAAKIDAALQAHV